MDKKILKWEYRDPAELKPYPQNTKLHDETQIDNVAKSIEKFGWAQPIAVDANDVVIIGHCRLLAAKKLRLKSVPVVRLDWLTDEQVRELRIADNKTNESPWDFSALEKELADLSFDGFDFDFDFSPLEQTAQTMSTSYPATAPEQPYNAPVEGEEDPYLPEPYDEDMANEYAKNAEEYVVKRRVIITYLPEQEQEVMQKLGIPGEGVDKVVYDITELQ